MTSPRNRSVLRTATFVWVTIAAACGSAPVPSPPYTTQAPGSQGSPDGWVTVGYADATARSADNTVLPGCSWPSSLDASDASSGYCVAARTLLSCTAPNGDGEGCLSDNATQCPSSSNLVGLDGPFTCADTCAAGEYAVACGGVGHEIFADAASPGGSTSSPPASCRFVSADPGGNEFYCCPCGPVEPDNASDGGAADAGTLDATVGAALDGAADVDAGPPAEAFVAAYLSPISGAASACVFSSSEVALQLGTSGATVPVPVASGASQDGELADVSCTVNPENGGFELSLLAYGGGDGGGAELYVYGHVTAAGGTVFVEFDSEYPGYGFYEDSSCTVSFTYEGNPLPPDAAALAPGSIWGHLDCPAMTNSLVETEDGGSTSSTCAGQADFLFESCQ